MSPITNFKSQILFAETLELPDVGRDLLIVDQNVLSACPQIQTMSPYIYVVQGGESLKDFSGFATHMEKILKLWNIPLSRDNRVVAIGGGSVGDFAGFFASILKRGVGLCQVPSTWLAAIDSAHGGKTALNFQGVKNQLGTFYPAQTVVLSKAILQAQPAERARDGFGELIKISLIDDKSIFSRIENGGASSFSELLWQLLKDAIEAKFAVVEKDPYEQLGPRQALNLGHTMGHVFEAHYGWTHGESVLQGLIFSLRWGVQRKITSSSLLKRVEAVLKARKLDTALERIDFSPLTYKQAEHLLARDKKINAQSKVNFVFIRDVGDVAIESVLLEEVLVEGLRQGWIDE